MGFTCCCHSFPTSIVVLVCLHRVHVLFSQWGIRKAHIGKVEIIIREEKNQLESAFDELSRENTHANDLMKVDCIILFNMCCIDAFTSLLDAILE